MIGRSIAIPLLVFPLAYITDARAELESAQLGLIAPINGKYELVEVRQQIPWKKDVCEPWFGVYLRFSSRLEHRVLFRVFRQDRKAGGYLQMQEDPEWVVVEGAVLTGEVAYSPGRYRYTVAIDDREPLEFDFEIAPFPEAPTEVCPGPTREEARATLRLQQADRSL
jgi:hypothetical protein